LKFVFAIIFFLAFSLQLLSQKWEIVEKQKEKVSFPPSRILVTKDTVYFAAKDTFVILKQHTKYKLRKNPYAKSELLYDSLQVKSDRNKLTAELYNLFFKRAPIEVHDTSNFEKGELAFEKYRGKTIRSIRIKQVDIIEGSIHDTLQQAKSTLVKGAKRIHVNTSKKTIRNNLTFKTGDELSPWLIADNERIIRNLKYIEDARIHVLPDSLDNTIVDILIVTKDDFSIGVGVDFNGFDNITLNLYEGNFLGIGHDMQHSYIYHNTELPQHGYAFRYRVGNIANSFISAKLQYESSWDKELKLISFNKSFLTPQTKYAGGISIYQIADTRSQSIGDTSVLVDYKAGIQDVWAARSFLFNNKNRVRVNFSLRYAHTNFINKPLAINDSNYFYHNSNLLLGEVAFVNRDFYKSSLVQGFGVTEDIPYGYTFRFQLGIDNNELASRPYIGASFTIAKHFEFPGYLKMDFALGNFYRNGQVEDGVVKFNFSHIGNLHRLNRYSLRNFLNIIYQRGINRTDADQKAILNSMWTKIATGLNKDRLEGIQKLSLNLESTLFTPWYLYGFKFAVFGYGSMGWVSENNTIFDKNRFLASIGAGFRLKNESWVFETLTIGFAWFVRAPVGSSPAGLMLDISNPRLFNNFYSDKPRFVEMDQMPGLFID
jgi:hypothetical protein